MASMRMIDDVLYFLDDQGEWIPLKGVQDVGVLDCDSGVFFTRDREAGKLLSARLGIPYRMIVPLIPDADTP